MSGIVRLLKQIISLWLTTLTPIVRQNVESLSSIAVAVWNIQLRQNVYKFLSSTLKQLKFDSTLDYYTDDNKIR